MQLGPIFAISILVFALMASLGCLIGIGVVDRNFDTGPKQTLQAIRRMGAVALVGLTIAWIWCLSMDIAWLIFGLLGTQASFLSALAYKRLRAKEVTDKLACATELEKLDWQWLKWALDSDGDGLISSCDVLKRIDQRVVREQLSGNTLRCLSLWMEDFGHESNHLWVLGEDDLPRLTSKISSRYGSWLEPK